MGKNTKDESFIDNNESLSSSIFKRMGFSSTYLRSSESFLIIKGMITLLENISGSTVLSSLKFLLKKFDDNKRLEQIIRYMISDIESQNCKDYEAFELYGLFTSEEAMKYRSSFSTPKTALESIINTRTFNNRVEPILFMTGLKFIIGIYLTFVLLVIYIDDIKTEYFDSISGIEEKSIKAHPFIINNFEYVYYFTAVTTVIFFGLILMYNFYYSRDRKVIYKILSLKAWEDMPIMFETMENFFKTERETKKVFAKMKGLSSYNGLSKMFEKLENSVSNIDDEKYDSFKDYNFPKDVWLLVQMLESGVLLDNLKPIINLSKAECKDRITKFEKSFGAYGTLMAAIIPVATFIYVENVVSAGFDYSIVFSQGGL